MREDESLERIRQLKAWEAAAVKEIEEITSKISPLEQTLRSARDRLDLIRRLLRMSESPAERQLRHLSEVRATVSAEGTSSPMRENLEAQLQQILQEAGRPMHISEIRHILVDRAVPLPGRGDEANIILRLRRAPDRFTRTGRGTYALSALGLQAVAPARRRRRLRGRKKS